VYALESLTPGASSLQQDFQVPTSTGGESAVSFNGLREGHNLWLIHGGEASDRGGAGGTDVMSVNDYADFLLGYAQKYQEYALKNTGYWNNISPAAYIQRFLHNRPEPAIQSSD